jgi:hypothetical protein
METKDGRARYHCQFEATHSKRGEYESTSRAKIEQTKLAGKKITHCKNMNSRIGDEG